MALNRSRTQACRSRLGKGVGCVLSFVVARLGGRINDTLFLPLYVHSGVPAARCSMAPQPKVLVKHFPDTSSSLSDSN